MEDIVKELKEKGFAQHIIEAIVKKYSHLENVTLKINTSHAYIYRNGRMDNYYVDTRLDRIKDSLRIKLDRMGFSLDCRNSLIEKHCNSLSYEEALEKCLQEGEQVSFDSISFKYVPHNHNKTHIRVSSKMFRYYHNSGTDFVDIEIDLDTEEPFPKYTKYDELKKLKLIFDGLDKESRNRVVFGVRNGYTPSQDGFLLYHKTLDNICLTLDGKVLYNNI